ncbi:MAG TPA: DUF72 domain-containing protein, partial [Sphingomonas sp.]|nr:DUF72 domain-containing protein [Sphingomonas sp.]
TSIEINGTYYRLQKRESFAKWRDATPDDFVFTVKGSRYVTNRKVLAEAGESIAKFVGQGIVELGDRLGPILWQFAPTKAFDPDDMRAFLALLPADHAGVALRHAVHVRHASFQAPEFVAMARAAGVAIVFADAVAHPAIADVTADFVYARLEAGVEEEPAGYSPAALDRWAEAARVWAAGGAPAGLPYVDAASVAATPRETFVFFINGAKVRAPHGAMALIDRVGR